MQIINICIIPNEFWFFGLWKFAAKSTESVWKSRRCSINECQNVISKIYDIYANFYHNFRILQPKKTTTDFWDLYRCVGRVTILDLWNKFSGVKFQMKRFVKRLLLERFVIRFANWKCLQPIVPYSLSLFRRISYCLLFACVCAHSWCI